MPASPRDAAGATAGAGAGQDGSTHPRGGREGPKWCHPVRAHVYLLSNSNRAPATRGFRNVSAITLQHVQPAVALSSTAIATASNAPVEAQLKYCVSSLCTASAAYRGAQREASHDASTGRGSSPPRRRSAGAWRRPRSTGGGTCSAPRAGRAWPPRVGAPLRLGLPSGDFSPSASVVRSLLECLVHRSSSAPRGAWGVCETALRSSSPCPEPQPRLCARPTLDRFKLATSGARCTRASHEWGDAFAQKEPMEGPVCACTTSECR